MAIKVFQNEILKRFDFDLQMKIDGDHYFRSWGDLKCIHTEKKKKKSYTVKRFTKRSQRQCTETSPRRARSNPDEYFLVISHILYLLHNVTVIMNGCLDVLNFNRTTITCVYEPKPSVYRFSNVMNNDD